MTMWRGCPGMTAGTSVSRRTVTAAAPERESCRYPAIPARIQRANDHDPGLPTITICWPMPSTAKTDGNHCCGLPGRWSSTKPTACPKPRSRWQPAACLPRGWPSWPTSSAAWHLTRAAQQVTACARALAGVYAPQQNEANAGMATCRPCRCHSP